MPRFSFQFRFGGVVVDRNSLGTALIVSVGLNNKVSQICSESFSLLLDSHDVLLLAMFAFSLH
jgi:hypothetical protein